jgi:ATP-dependent DNA helicase RecG
MRRRRTNISPVVATKIVAEDKRKEPRFYMELAIQAMKDSKDELNKNTPSPRVGAVLVFPDGTYETASRGEFREGDHAEYTLLDKKFRTKDLSECWLFATLEPCGPKARKFPKLCCAERIGNARIKKVWYGVQELNSKAQGGKTLLVEEFKAEVLPFDTDLHREIIEYNKDFNDWVEEEKKKEERAIDLVSGPLQKPVKNANIESLSKEAIELYIAKTKKEYSYNSVNLKDDLINKGLLEIDEKTGEVSPTGDCMLLFGKAPRDKFPQASVKAKVDYGGGGEPDTESFDDALILVPDKVKEWAKKVIPESIDRSDFTREKFSHFPPDVIREVIVNAIIHRDYSIRSAKVELEITPDKIEVRSPGEPVSPNTLKDLQNFTAISQTRNPELAYIFNIMRYMEETGVGMDTYRTMREKYNLPLPIITYKKPNLIVTFPRTIDSVKRAYSSEVIEQLSDAQLNGFEWIKIKGEASTREYSSHFDIGYKTAQRHLSKMKELGLITDNGEDVNSPNYKYVIV